MSRHTGFTLVELLVVLIVMSLAAALVAPAILSRRQDDSALKALVASARAAAARRGEILYLHLEPTGRWRLEGGANLLEGTLATGQLPPLVPVSVTLVVSPIGSCAFDVKSAAVATAAVALEPLTCELRTS